MADTIDVKPGDFVQVVNAEVPKRAKKPTFLVGQILRVHYVTASRTALCVAGHDGLWRASRFKPAT